jgi:hypothetical protein
MSGRVSLKPRDNPAKQSQVSSSSWTTMKAGWVNKQDVHDNASTNAFDAQCKHRFVHDEQQ